MKYVLDASVGLKWLLVESDSPKANQLRDDFSNKIHELLAPDVFPIEVGHSLTRAERRSIIQPGEASILYDDLLRTLPEIRPTFGLLPRAIELSSQVRIGVYDCLYVALAEQEGCEVVTGDVRMAQLFPSAVLLKDV